MGSGRRAAEVAEDFLEDSRTGRQRRRQPTEVQLWFEDMRKLAYDADSLLDHISLHLSTYCAHHSVTYNQENQMLSMVLSSFKKLSLPHEIPEMQKKLDDLAKEFKDLAKNEEAKSGARIASGRWSSSRSNLSSGVVGRTEDKDCIVNLVRKECEGDCNFSVITIMGMIGIGKTAVAHHVFDTVSGDFDLRIWVFVSADFDVVRITKCMIEFATDCAYDVSDLESLQFKLRNVLHNRKVLLILDGYESEDFNDWGVLSWPFSSAARDSKIIVTTRNKKVSAVVCSSKTHTLEILSDDDCWEVIKQRAMMGVELSDEQNSIGR